MQFSITKLWGEFNSFDMANALLRIVTEYRKAREQRLINFPENAYVEARAISKEQQ